jgi:hypothetical protein
MLVKDLVKGSFRIDKSIEMEKQYILNGCSQNGYQWDGSLYEISPKATVILIRKRLIRDNLYKLKSDGRILAIPESIINRYFVET